MRLQFCFNEPPADVLAHAEALGLPLTRLQREGVLHHLPQRIERFIAALTLELRQMGTTSVFSFDACDSAGIR